MWHGVILLVCAAACAQAFTSSTFVCRSPPYEPVAIASLRDGSCDCCDCSDEPAQLRTADAAACRLTDATLEAAALRRDGLLAKNADRETPVLSSVLEAGAKRRKQRLGGVTEQLRVAEGLEREERRAVTARRWATYRAAVGGLRLELNATAVRRIAADAAASRRERSAEAVVDVVRDLGFDVDEVGVLTAAADGLDVDGPLWLGRCVSDDATRDTFLRRLLTQRDVGATVAAQLAEQFQVELPQHPATLPAHVTPDAEAARSKFRQHTRDENDFIALQRYVDQRGAFDYGPKRRFLHLDGVCLTVPREAALAEMAGDDTAMGNPAFLDVPYEVCLYRVARFENSTLFIKDVQRGDGGVPDVTGAVAATMVFVDVQAISKCERAGHGQRTVVVRLVCYYDDVVLFAEVGGPCRATVTVGTPTACGP